MAINDRLNAAFENKGKESKKVTIPTPPVTPVSQVVNTNQTPVVSKKPKAVSQTIGDDVPTPIRQVAREDVPLSNYGSPVQNNFQLFDEELDDWLKSFSRKNQRRGGAAITKSQFIHICMDVIKYDMEIEPIGYESHQQLREDLQSRLKGR
jgi:hypothetical protein